MTTASHTYAAHQYDVVVVGAGFAGLYLVHLLRGRGYSVIAFEAGDGVGGTWYWNKYPGARCDVESLDYSYSFSSELEQEWSWSERYPAQPELLRYANHVADRFDLRRDIVLSTRVTRASWDDEEREWTIETDRGTVARAAFCVMATGMLSATQLPSIDGIEDFAGDIVHTARWPEQGVDFARRRVGVIGTGSSGIQVIPEIAKSAHHLTVFQRTPNFTIPAWNGPLDSRWEREVKQSYQQRRKAARWSPSGTVRELNPRPASSYDEYEREAEYWRRWKIGGAAFVGAFSDLLVDPSSNETAAEFVRQRIRDIVVDQSTAEMLCPKDFPIGTKRICTDTDYYATFNRENVRLVDVRRDPIVRFCADGLQTTKETHELDVLVCATGFDAMTGALLRIQVTGRNGVKLGDKWAAGPRTYLGVASAGFPNLFIITGPGSPSVLSNMMTSIEQHVEWIIELIDYLHDHGLAMAEPEDNAEEQWVQHVNDLAAATLHMKANSWYLGANIPGKPRVFMPYVGGVGTYRAKCDEVARDGYAGFILT